MGDNVVSGGEAFDWEAAEDMTTALSEGELRARPEEPGLEELRLEERAVRSTTETAEGSHS